MGAITPAAAAPWYWQYRGRPMLLLGGSSEDNLFQVAEVEGELDKLAACGGNYVRCTLSSRDPGDVWPYAQDNDGRYDLDRFSDAYWGKLESFLAACDQRHIVVQIECWDRFDFAREPWQANPFNPANNVNDQGQSGLATDYPGHPGNCANDFFHSVPALQHNGFLLQYQEAFMDRMLAAIAPYEGVLLCMDNETNDDPAWGRYWAEFIHQRAPERACTEMYDPWHLADVLHQNTLDGSPYWHFVEVSQNNHHEGEMHWRSLLEHRNRVSKATGPRPMNNVKIYGAPGGSHSSARNAIECFWRCLLAGCASVRFHRPPTGFGLAPVSRACIGLARQVFEGIDLGSFGPKPELFHRRTRNGAYVASDDRGEALLYFPDIECCQLKADGPLRVTWNRVLDGVNATELVEPEDGVVTLAMPWPEGHVVARISPA